MSHVRTTTLFLAAMTLALLPSGSHGLPDKNIALPFAFSTTSTSSRSADQMMTTGLMLARKKDAFIITCNLLSFLGSILIILHIPQVTKRVPTQRKRMLIVLFTAISNLGFSIANIITDFRSTTSKVGCTLSAFSYVFFQLLTCTLVILSSFRLCGVFLFKRQRTLPSKFILICPLVAIALSTPPAIAGQFTFTTCGQYCWFASDTTRDCKVRSLWPWLSFYSWMLLFLIILFGSTLFVMAKIGLAIMSSRSSLKAVVHQAMAASSPNTPQTHPETTSPREERSRMKSIASIFSSKTRQSGQSLDLGQQDPNGNPTVAFGETALTSAVLPIVPHISHISNLASFGLDSPTLRSEGILALETTPDPQEQGTSSLRPQSAITSPRQDPLTNNTRRTSSRQPSAGKDRPFLMAVLRQALYPISISLTGCIQIFVDLTIDKGLHTDDPLDYFATAATSLQGFLFFMVFLFDPAVVQTRQYWRKYLTWRYYVEFYFGLGMLQEGKDFEKRWIEQCEGLGRSDPRVDRLVKPPIYAWLLHYDHEDLIHSPSAEQEAVSTLVSPQPASIPAAPSEESLLSMADFLRRGPHGGKHGLNIDYGDDYLYTADMEQGTSLATSGTGARYARNLHLAPLPPLCGSSSGVIMEKRVHPMTSFNPISIDITTATTTVGPDNDVQLSSLSPSTHHLAVPETATRATSISYDAQTPRDQPSLITSSSRSTSLPLSRILTIGGSDRNGRHRSWQSRASSGRHASTTMSADLQQQQQQRTRTPYIWSRKSREDEVETQQWSFETYHSAFKWPKLAYGMHLLIRRFYVPKEARLPPIPRPDFSSNLIRDRAIAVDLIRTHSWVPDASLMAGTMAAMDSSDLDSVRVDRGLGLDMAMEGEVRQVGTESVVTTKEDGD